MLEAHQINLICDVHGLAARHELDINIGSAGFFKPQLVEDKDSDLVDVFSVAVDKPYNGADGITGMVDRSTALDVSAIQLEFGLRLRSDTTDAADLRRLAAVLGRFDSRRRFCVSTDWSTRLIAAANSDNENLSCRCSTSTTRDLLTTAPLVFQEHAALVLTDFARAGDAPLSDLRSDTVARQFRVTVTPPARNLFVARMTVPGGPWPGHFGLEAIVFDAFKVSFPTWFPSIEPDYSLYFADVVTASNAFMRGQGAVLFPELLSLRDQLERQSFGVVFLDRLTTLYVSKVLPVLSELRIEATTGIEDARTIRQLAFLAHEWGHLHGPVPYEKTVRFRRRRLIAIVSELYADLAGLAMLLNVGTVVAKQAAEMLILDRVVREAWLPRARSQVDSVTARHLLALLSDTDYIEVMPHGLWLHLERGQRRLRQELSVVSEVEAACANGDVEPARKYLISYGWRLDDSGYQIDLCDPLSRLLRIAVKKVCGSKLVTAAKRA